MSIVMNNPLINSKKRKYGEISATGSDQNIKDVHLSPSFNIELKRNSARTV
jgi:hypothetical protein